MIINQIRQFRLLIFFDPGYVSQALGFQYSHGEIFSSRLGVALQQTFANKFAAAYTDDIETTDKIEDSSLILVLNPCLK